MAGSMQVGTLAHTQRLRERLTAQVPTYVDVGGGSSRRTGFTDGDTVRGRVRPMKGREYLQARQVIGGTPYEVTIRYPLPAGMTLKGSDLLKWHAPTGDVVLHLQEPPRLSEDRRYLTFLAATKEAA